MEVRVLEDSLTPVSASPDTRRLNWKHKVRKKMRAIIICMLLAFLTTLTTVTIYLSLYPPSISSQQIGEVITETHVAAVETFLPAAARIPCASGLADCDNIRKPCANGSRNVNHIQYRRDLWIHAKVTGLNDSPKPDRCSCGLKQIDRYDLKTACDLFCAINATGLKLNGTDCDTNWWTVSKLRFWDNEHYDWKSHRTMVNDTHLIQLLSYWEKAPKQNVTCARFITRNKWMTLSGVDNADWSKWAWIANCTFRQSKRIWVVGNMNLGSRDSEWQNYTATRNLTTFELYPPHPEGHRLQLVNAVFGEDADTDPEPIEETLEPKMLHHKIMAAEMIFNSCSVDPGGGKIECSRPYTRDKWFNWTLFKTPVDYHLSSYPPGLPWLKNITFGKYVYHYFHAPVLGSGVEAEITKATHIVHDLHKCITQSLPGAINNYTSTGLAPFALRIDPGCKDNLKCQFVYGISPRYILRRTNWEMSSSGLGLTKSETEWIKHCWHKSSQTEEDKVKIFVQAQFAAMITGHWLGLVEGSFVHADPDLAYNTSSMYETGRKRVNIGSQKVMAIPPPLVTSKNFTPELPHQDGMIRFELKLAYQPTANPVEAFYGFEGLVKFGYYDRSHCTAFNQKYCYDHDYLYNDGYRASLNYLTDRHLTRRIMTKGGKSRVTNAVELGWADETPGNPSLRRWWPSRSEPRCEDGTPYPLAPIALSLPHFTTLQEEGRRTGLEWIFGGTPYLTWQELRKWAKPATRARGDRDYMPINDYLISRTAWISRVFCNDIATHGDGMILPDTQALYHRLDHVFPVNLTSYTNWENGNCSIGLRGSLADRWSHMDLSQEGWMKRANLYLNAIGKGFSQGVQTVVKGAKEVSNIITDGIWDIAWPWVKIIIVPLILVGLFILLALLHSAGLLGSFLKGLLLIFKGLGKMLCCTVRLICQMSRKPKASSRAGAKREHVQQNQRMLPLHRGGHNKQL